MHTQNLIIGFGKAGKTLAADLAKHGQQVVLVEQSAQMYGGTEGPRNSGAHDEAYPGLTVFSA